MTWVRKVEMFLVDCNVCSHNCETLVAVQEDLCLGDGLERIGWYGYKDCSGYWIAVCPTCADEWKEAHR